MERLKVYQAQPEDWPDVRRLLLNVATWLKDRGSQQWESLLRGEDSHQTEQRIHEGQVYIARDQAQSLIGMFILYDEPSDWDSDLWEDLPAREAYYLHRLAVSRSHAGKDYGSQLLDAAKEIGRRSKKTSIRLDCRSEKERLNNLYRKNNFNYLACKKEYPDGSGYSDFNLYEYEL